MKLKQKQNIKTIINIITAIIFVTIIIVSLVRNAELNESSNKLSNDISEREKIINRLTNDNRNLNEDIKQLNEYADKLEENIGQLEDANNKLHEEDKLSQQKIKDLVSEIEKLENELSQLKELSYRKDFKSYMPYQAITNKESMQWKLQLQATTNEDGIRCIDGIPLVAVGTGWGLWVGDVAIVTCENGNTFKVMVGDIKDDSHTDAANKTTVSNGCRCEFIVDVEKIDATARKLGNMATLSKYSGYVVNIEKAD